MIPINPAVSGRRRASKAYLALSGATGQGSRSFASQVELVAPWPLDRASPEIGSLPINALAIALALAAGFPQRDRGLVAEIS
jgi:hypothetical protein